MVAATPWVSIIIGLLTYFLQSRNGGNKGKAAVTAGLAGVASYYAFDPANKDNWAGITYGEKSNAGDTGDSSGQGTEPATSSGGSSGSSSWWGEVGSTLKSWGGYGTAAVVGASSLSGSKWLPWALGGAALFLLLK